MVDQVLAIGQVLAWLGFRLGLGLALTLALTLTLAIGQVLAWPVDDVVLDHDKPAWSEARLALR